MRAFVAFVAYLLGALFLSALLLPVLYPGVRALLGDGTEPSGVLYRFAMLFMLLGFPWFLKRMGLFGWREIGFTLPARAAWRSVLQGLGIGFLMLLVVGLGLVLAGARVYAPDEDGLSGLIGVIVAGVLGGLVIGLIEEAFFRGMMHTGMRRSLSFPGTAVLTAAFYSAVHFIRPQELPAGADLDVIESVSIVLGGLGGLADVARIHDSFLALFAAGVFLSMVRERTGHIGWVIGIHAGWVLVIRLMKFLTEADPGDGMSFWIGDYDKVIGWLAAIWIAALATLYWRYTARAERARDSGRQHQPQPEDRPGRE